MSMEQNQLTRDLYAAGYTREDHPSFVYWSDWQNFGYLFEALLKFTWETPCGLLVDGKSDLGRGLACSDASFQGIDYCPENDNPLLRCPYERKDCPHSISGFPVPLCPCHTTGKRYSFEQSAEKVETERSERQHRQYTEITGGVYCACVVGCNGYEGGRVEVKYDVEQCIRCRCQNPVCVIRKQKRDLSRANIFYDVRRTWITRIGFLEEKKVQVTKGERDSMHNAQCLAGMAFSNALLGIAHSMAHKTGAAFADYGAHIIHGAANAMYLPKVIAFNAKDPEAKKRYGVIADEMKLGGANDDEKVKLLIEYLRGMNDALNIPHCIQHYGPDSYPTEQGFVPENVFLERLPEIAKNAIADACTGSNPRQPSQEEMEKLLKCCYYDTEVDF